MPSKLQNKGVFAIVAAMALAALVACGQTVRTEVFVARAEKAFAGAWQKFQSDTNSADAACEFGRASSELAELATNDTQRAEVARRGIAVCRQLLAKEPDSAPGHYYLAMNLGQLAQADAPSLTAYRLVHEVEHEFKTAAALNVRLDYGGPARTLGLLYYQAPGWPLSVGSKSKAREWLERAATLAPDYPENQLNLAEAQLKWRERKKLEATLKKLDAIWPVARTNLTGEAWQESWQEWDSRRAALKADYRRIYAAKP